MKQLSLIISATVLFAGPVFAAPIHDALTSSSTIAYDLPCSDPN